MNNNTKIFEPTYDRNCAKCTLSIRNVENLLLLCGLGKKIENTWVTAHNCKHYNDTNKPQKHKKHKKNITNQLKLF